MTVTKEKLIENTSILIKEHNYKNLIIKEALYILRHSSRINVQFQNLVINRYGPNLMHCNARLQVSQMSV